MGAASITIRSEIPAIRLRAADDRPADPGGQFVLYWMHAARRTGWNFALQRAVEWAREVNRPLLVVEVLASSGRWASDRHHRFVLEGMAENAKRLARGPARYYPYVERRPGEASRLLAALAKEACVAVADEYPVPLPGEAPPELNVRLEQVDTSGLLPLRAADRTFTTAASFRRFLQRVLPDHLLDLPRADPLARARLPRLDSLPANATRRWPAAGAELLAGRATALAALPINHAIQPVATPGGPMAAAAALQEFLRHRLPRYDCDRNHPDEDASSRLSPHLHFGHISVHEIFAAIAGHEQWSPDRLAAKATGKREGWWGMSGPAEAFLDELVIWREIGFNLCARQSDFDRYESLPAWAKVTLATHRRDPRPIVYSQEELESSRTYDRLWNAAQRELVQEGRMHNYLRMLWGKKILQWSDTPEEALRVMIELNNKYAVDGQDPNSYSGIFWVLGRYDRPWGPERPIFGKVRYMSSENTLRKVHARKYLERLSGVRTSR